MRKEAFLNLDAINMAHCIGEAQFAPSDPSSPYLTCGSLCCAADGHVESASKMCVTMHFGRRSCIYSMLALPPLLTCSVVCLA